MKKHGWMWWVCSLLLAGCLPIESTPMISTPKASMPMTLTSTPIPLTLTPTLLTPTSTPLTSTPMPLTSTPITSTPKPQALVINEYLLSGKPDISTEHLVFHFADGNQDEILARTEKYRDYRRQIEEYNNRVLKSFDYRQKDYQQDDNGSGYLFWHSNIFHGDELIISNALFVMPVSVNASGTDFITEVVAYDNNYLLTSDSFEKIPWPRGREPYLYMGNQPLSVEITGLTHPELALKVYIGDKVTYQSIIHGITPYGEMDGPWSYNGHWALVIIGEKQDSQGNWKPVTRVIQDGQDLNLINGYEQSFQFAVLDNRPFYFFQKNGKIGISFDRREIAKDYDEIPHYSCCSPALLNPGISMNMIWFFAKRGDNWYYVEAYIPE